MALARYCRPQFDLSAETLPKSEYYAFLELVASHEFPFQPQFIWSHLQRIPNFGKKGVCIVSLAYTKGYNPRELISTARTEVKTKLVQSFEEFLVEGTGSEGVYTLLEIAKTFVLPMMRAVQMKKTSYVTRVALEDPRDWLYTLPGVELLIPNDGTDKFAHHLTRIRHYSRLRSGMKVTRRDSVDPIAFNHGNVDFLSPQHRVQFWTNIRCWNERAGDIDLDKILPYGDLLKTE